MPIHAIGVFDSIPHVKHGGGGIQSYGMLRSLRWHGFSVTALILPPSMPLLGDQREADVAHLNGFGINVVEILPAEGGLRIAGLEAGPIAVPRQPTPEVLAQLVSQIAERCRADVAFTYHWAGIQALSFIRTIPKLGVVVDPMHLPFLLRRKFTSQYASDDERATLSLSAAQEEEYVRATEQNMVRMLQSCDASVCFAAHHAAQYAELGASNCRYLPCALPDPHDGTLPPAERGVRFRILHIGHLRGIATLTGVDLLAHGVLPELDRLLPPDSFEIHIVGGYAETLPAGLRKALDHPAVVFRGQVVPPDDEFLRAHVALVPTPAELGMRVRVATGFAYGSCVVAHRANACGIPEMVHGENCLLGDDGESLARHCAAVFQDTALRLRLEQSGRKTFEQTFTYDTAGKSLADLLSDVVARRRETAPSPEPQTMTLDQAFALAGQHWDAGRRDEAEMVYRSILRAHPAHAPSLHGLGELFLAAGRPMDCIETVSHALLLAPDLLDAYVTLGMAYEARDNRAAAQAAYRRALSMKADFAPARKRLDGLDAADASGPRKP